MKKGTKPEHNTKWQQCTWLSGLFFILVILCVVVESGDCVCMRIDTAIVWSMAVSIQFACDLSFRVQVVVRLWRVALKQNSVRLCRGCARVYVPSTALVKRSRGPLFKVSSERPNELAIELAAPAWEASSFVLHHRGLFMSGKTSAHSLDAVSNVTSHHRAAYVLTLRRHSLLSFRIFQTLLTAQFTERWLQCCWPVIKKVGHILGLHCRKIGIVETNQKAPPPPSEENFW